MSKKVISNVYILVYDTFSLMTAEETVDTSFNAVRENSQRDCLLIRLWNILHPHGPTEIKKARV